jgi:hypothetical protein
MRGVGRVAIGAGALALALAACNAAVPTVPTVPTLPPIATSVGTSIGDGTLTLTVTPWPLDSTVAFLCVDKPGKEFTVDHPVPAAVAQCVPLDVSTSGDRLMASLGTDRMAGFRFARPVYLAVAGSRGPISTSTVLTVALLSPSAAPG